jgi:hypothetical protein
MYRYAAERDALLQAIETGLPGDERVIATWLVGSIGRGEGDGSSDLDLWVVIRDDAIARIADDPSAFVNGIVPTILDIGALSNAPAGGAFLLTWIAGEHGPQQVDWYWQPEKDATRPRSSVILFERVPIRTSGDRVILAGDVLEQAIDASIRETLMIMFVTARHVRRSDPWSTVRHLEHVDRCLGNLRWLLEKQSLPTYDDAVHRSLPMRLPASPAEQIECLLALSTTFAELLAWSHRERQAIAAHESLRACLEQRGP